MTLSVSGVLLAAVASKDYVEYYIKTMSRILEKGDDYVKNVSCHRVFSNTCARLAVGLLGVSGRDACNKQ
jgi:hypothetical protein